MIDSAVLIGPQHTHCKKKDPCNDPLCLVSVNAPATAAPMEPLRALPSAASKDASSAPSAYAAPAAADVAGPTLSIHSPPRAAAAAATDQRRPRKLSAFFGGAPPNVGAVRQSAHPRLRELPLADPVAVAALPRDPATGTVCVYAYVSFKKMRAIDAKASSVGSAFILHLRWKCPDLQGCKLSDVSRLWRPNISILNRDRLRMEHRDPWFFPDTGEVRWTIVCDGTFGNEMGLHYFPFDGDSLSILLVAEEGSDDDTVRLAWQRTAEEQASGSGAGRYARAARSAAAVTPGYVARQMAEWHFFPELNSVRRMKPQPNIFCDMQGIEIRIYIARRWQFYVYKILLIIIMMTVLSWFVLWFDDSGEVGLDQVSHRLAFSSSLLLASVAFMYISSESIPKLSYLTTMDKMILYSFLNLFLVMVEAFLVFRLSQGGVDPSVINMIDAHAGWFLPLMYAFNIGTSIVCACRARRRNLREAVAHQTGIEEALLMTRQEELAAQNWWHLTE